MIFGIAALDTDGWLQSRIFLSKSSSFVPSFCRVRLPPVGSGPFKIKSTGTVIRAVEITVVVLGLFLVRFLQIVDRGIVAATRPNLRLVTNLRPAGPSLEKGINDAFRDPEHIPGGFLDLIQGRIQLAQGEGRKFNHRSGGVVSRGRGDGQHLVLWRTIFLLFNLLSLFRFFVFGGSIQTVETVDLPISNNDCVLGFGPLFRNYVILHRHFFFIVTAESGQQRFPIGYGKV